MSIATIPANTSGLNMRNLTNSNFTAVAPKIYVYPEDFGAVGDGTTDDTTALQACISSLATSHGTVILSAKTYKVTAVLTVPSYVNIEGISNVDSTIKSTSTTLDIIQVTGNAANCSSTSGGLWNSFRNFGVSRSAQATVGDGFHLVNTCYCSFFQVYSFDSKNGFYLSGCGNTHLTSVYAGWTTATTVTRNGIFLDSSANANASTIIDGHCVSNGGAANGTGLLVSGACIADLFVYGFETALLDVGVHIVSTLGSSTTLSTCNSDIHLSKLILDQIGAKGVWIQNVNGGGVPCVQIDSSHFESSTTAVLGIFIDTSFGVIVSGCQFNIRGGGSSVGIYTAGAQNCTIIGNVFEDNVNGIYLDGSSKLNSVTGNILAAATDNAAGTHITLVNSATLNIIASNVLSGFATTGLSFASGCNNNIAWPNIIDPANIGTPISNNGSGNVTTN